MTLQKTTLLISALATWCAQAIYTVSPIDLIPDIIPILGLVDDMFGFFLVLGFTGYTIYRLTKRTEGPAPGEPKPQSAKSRTKQDLDYRPLSLEEIKAM